MADNPWQEKYVASGGYQDGLYTDKPNPTLTPFQEDGHDFKYAASNAQASSVWAWWTPTITEGGQYEIQVWVPKQHATTRNARYHLHGVKGHDSSFPIPVNQGDFPGEWVSMGVYELDPAGEHPGRVNLNNLTGEPDKEVAFTGVRWRKYVPEAAPAQPTSPDATEEQPLPPVEPAPQQPQAPVADGFDSPVGIKNPKELGPDGLWLDNPGPTRQEWYLATDYNQRYKDSSGTAAIHTGIDLNLNPVGQWNKDAGQPVYAVASGTVVFAQFVPAYWGNIVVIQHDPLEAGGAVVYSRSAHLGKIVVTKGQPVKRGDQVGVVGSNTDKFGNSVHNEHLHFDISPTEALLRNATDWPKMDESRILRDYVNPRTFIAAHRPKK